MKKADSKNILMKFVLVAVAVALFVALVGIVRTVAFTGPSGNAGSGSGALGTDASGDISIGTSTTQSSTKLFVLGSTANSSAYGLQVWNSASTPLLTVRNDGAVSIPGVATIGTLTATLNASNISSGQFAAGNFSFQNNLGIGTTTPASPLTVSGSIAIVGSGNGLVFPDATTQVTAAT
jgi:hypothetical protein